MYYLSLDPPRIIIGPATIDVKVDRRGNVVELNNVTFTCIAEGNERPEITWYYRNAVLPAGPIVEFEGLENPPTASYSKDFSRLTIQEIHAAVLYTYSCSASNSLGRDFAEGELRRVNVR